MILRYVFNIFRISEERFPLQYTARSPVRPDRTHRSCTYANCLYWCIARV